MFCKNCGKQIDDKAVICVHCGVPTDNYQQSVQPPVYYPQAPIVVNANANANASSYSSYPYKSKWTALILCLLLGMAGVHRFYVGKVGTGLLWLLTMGMFGFGAFIDFFVILFGGFRDSNGMPLK